MICSSSFFPEKESLLYDQNTTCCMGLEADNTLDRQFQHPETTAEHTPSPNKKATKTGGFLCSSFFFIAAAIPGR
jgi:hypothetical protein